MRCPRVRGGLRVPPVDEARFGPVTLLGRRGGDVDGREDGFGTRSLLVTAMGGLDGDGGSRSRSVVDSSTGLAGVFARRGPTGTRGF